MKPKHLNDQKINAIIYKATLILWFKFFKFN